MRYLEQKYKFDHRDISGNLDKKDYNAELFPDVDRKEYLDFWHYIMDEASYGEMSNGKIDTIYIDDYFEDDEDNKTPNWVRTIFKLIKKEFCPNDDLITFEFVW